MKCPTCNTDYDYDEDPPPRAMVVEINGESTFRKVDYHDNATRVDYPVLKDGEEVHFTIGGRVMIVKVKE